MSRIAEAHCPALEVHREEKQLGHRCIKIPLFCPFHLGENSFTVGQLKINGNIYAIIITEEGLVVVSVSSSRLYLSAALATPILVHGFMVAVKLHSEWFHNDNNKL